MHGNNMKKVFGVFVLGLLMVSMSLGFVSAAEGDAPVKVIQEGVKSGYSAVEPILKFAVGDTSDSPELFLAKILLAIIIFSIIWMALSKIAFFQENDWSMWTVGIAVSLLAIRWLGNESIINTIILPYSALGIAISAGLPFVLAFLIIENNFNKTMRKIGWVFFIVIFVGLWIMRAGKSGTEAVGGPVGPFAWIYLATAGLALAVLLFDGTIQKLMSKSKIERIQSSHNSQMAGDLRDEMKKLTARYKEEKDDYEAIYTNKKGHAGWKDDMDKIKDSIASLKSE